jgi:hypothetical protein
MPFIISPAQHLHQNRFNAETLKRRGTFLRFSLNERQATELSATRLRFPHSRGLGVMTLLVCPIKLPDSSFQAQAASYCTPRKGIPCPVI